MSERPKAIDNPSIVFEAEKEELGGETVTDGFVTAKREVRNAENYV
ncbi:hypothetical protein [Sinorhizobium medicae]|nr:hypothetical protein [Sinorhizobium medicae]